MGLEIAAAAEPDSAIAAGSGVAVQAQQQEEEALGPPREGASITEEEVFEAAEHGRGPTETPSLCCCDLPRCFIVYCDGFERIQSR